MIDVWCVRAEFGKYAQAFLKGGYAAIGWIEDQSLADCKSRDDIPHEFQDRLSLKRGLVLS